MTMIEMLISIAIYLVLMLAVTAAVTSLYRQNAYAIEQAGEVSNARRGMAEWNRDVKEMITAEDGTYPVAVINEHTLGYYSDTDRDTSVEYVEYELSTTTLRKHTYNATGTPPVYDLTTPDQSEILSKYVQNIAQSTSTFLYFDADGNQLSSTSPLVDVRYIKAQFIVNIDPDRNPGEFMLRSSLAPRNLKDNL